MKKKVKEFVRNNKRASKRIEKLTDAQRLLARYIQLYEKDEITDSKLRTLSYACKTYSEISKIHYLEDFENRLTNLEANNEKF